MSVNIVLLLVMGVMYAGGVYLLLERTLTRVLLGILLMTNATNMLILIMSGAPGEAPLVEDGLDPGAYTDPLPQALTLTAIVISFAITAFMLGMIYRSWKLGRRDEVLVDTEDVKVAEQPSFDAEDDAELLEETSEFLDEDEDPNADYEHATAINPSTGPLPVKPQRDGTVRVRPTVGRRRVQEMEEGERPVGSSGHDDHLPDEDERAGSPRSRPPRSTEHQQDNRQDTRDGDGRAPRGRRRKGDG
ncbi:MULTISPECIES: Na(+)/H(+) antiporter subunit C [Citricoccus]|uniref:Na(+)/H(+) antiporter subunit C n=1 Tax=Citricoccus TaxID=169133 RepID=UPI000255F5FD